MKRYFYRFDLSFIMLFFVALALSACDMTSKSQVSTAPIEVHHDRYEETFAFNGIDGETARVLARHYDRFGQGNVDVMVTYPAGQSSVRANREAARVADALHRAGIADVETSTLPLQDVAHVDLVRVSYRQVTAHAPRGCGAHPAGNRDSIAGNEDGKFTQYRFGCGVDSFIAQQVVRPKDLLGNAALDQASGERAATRLEDYREGKDTKALSAQNASEEN